MNNKNLKHIWFDFHHECRKMKYENLSLLIDMFKDDLQEIGYFELTYTKDKVNHYYNMKLFINELSQID